jgi:two-component system, NarL family, sensor histidine kinase UhpB
MRRRDLPAAMRRRPQVRLFWRLFIPNAGVLCGAGLVLVVAPANGRVLVLGAGVAVMLLINLFLMRRAVGPLERLIALMRRVDPLAPGERVPYVGSTAELTDLAAAFNDMLDRLETERRESARRALAAQEDGQRRVAGELHDEIGQSLTALLWQLRRGAAGGNGATALLEQAAESAEQILDEVRAVAQQLRPEALDDLGLASALDSLCERLSQSSGLRITRTLDRDLGELDAEAELVLYRVAQESLTNVIRHAGATRAEVSLERAGGAVVLAVGDDGRGLGRSPPPPTGGIRGMRERALTIGGRLGVEEVRPHGLRVTLRVATR